MTSGLLSGLLGVSAAAWHGSLRWDVARLFALGTVLALLVALKVDFLKPTPLAGQLEIRGRVKEIKGRKVIVETTVLAGGVATARGEVVAVQMPENFGA